VDGTKTPPHPHTSTFADGSLTISTDPATLQWFRQDQLILSMLMATISDELLPQVLGCRTAQELWNALAKTFASTARARMLSLHYELATANKGSSSIIAYFQRIKQISATLAAAKRPLNDFEFTSYLLAGLGPEYDPLITSITTQVEPLTMDDLLGHLLAHEMKIEKNIQPELLLANLAFCGQKPPRVRSRNNSSWRSPPSGLSRFFTGTPRSSHFPPARHPSRGLLPTPGHGSSSHGPPSMGPTLIMAQCPPQGLFAKYVAKRATEL
jgi:hypothetical protein